MLSHPRPRAHLSPILLIPPVVASARLTLTQNAAATLIPSHHSLRLFFSGLDLLTCPLFYLTRQLALVTRLNKNSQPASFFIPHLPNTAVQKPFLLQQCIPKKMKKWGNSLLQLILKVIYGELHLVKNKQLCNYKVKERGIYLSKNMKCIEMTVR